MGTYDHLAVDWKSRCEASEGTVSNLQLCIDDNGREVRRLREDVERLTEINAENSKENDCQEDDLRATELKLARADIWVKNHLDDAALDSFRAALREGD